MLHASLLMNCDVSRTVLPAARRGTDRDLAFTLRLYTQVTGPLQNMRTAAVASQSSVEYQEGAYRPSDTDGAFVHLSP